MLRNQQKYITMCFLYGDFREYVDLLDPMMFGRYRGIVKNIKENETVKGIFDACFGDPVIQDLLEHDSDQLMVYKLFIEDELRRLFELYVDDRFKNGSDTLSKKNIDKINLLHEKLDKSLESKKGTDNLLDETLGYIKLANEESGSLKTGIACIDEYIGWIRPGTVTRINGYSNMGKSRFMYRIMANMLKDGRKIELFSLEVTRSIFFMNLVSAFYEIDANKFEKGMHNDKIKDFYEEYSEYIVVHDNKYNLSDIIKTWKDSKSDVFFIDYVQNIKGPGSNSVEKTGNIASEIQLCAIETEKPMIDLSQISNEGARGYKVGDIIPSKGSGDLVNTADVGIVLHPSKWLVPDDKKAILVTIAKNKFGPNNQSNHIEGDMAKCKFTHLGGFHELTVN